MKKIIYKLLLKTGLVKRVFPRDFDPKAIDIIKHASLFTDTGDARLFSLIEAVRYIEAAGIPGEIVECGVFRGGSMVAAALTLTTQRELYLFDTYEGMPKPTDRDIDSKGIPAIYQHLRTKTPTGSNWCYASLEDVQRNMQTTSYPIERVHFLKGLVQQTIPGNAPEQIALLRLDTDWYDSTKHELVNLYPRLVKGGVLILDDYGKWKGSRDAVDEYFREIGIKPLLARIDDSGRMMVKH
jgi:O-methyltransferase